MLTDYTSYDTIRAILSLDEAELTDGALSQPIFETMLLEDLASVAADMVERYEEVLARPPTTAEEKRFVRVLQAFSGYSVAKQLTVSLGMLALKSENDARAGYERFADSTDDVVMTVDRYYVVSRGYLIDAYNALFDPDIAAPVYSYAIVGSVGLATDPVTGE